jgi:hypothetical protein
VTIIEEDMTEFNAAAVGAAEMTDNNFVSRFDIATCGFARVFAADPQCTPMKGITILDSEPKRSSLSFELADLLHVIGGDPFVRSGPFETWSALGGLPTRSIRRPTPQKS